MGACVCAGVTVPAPHHHLCRRSAAGVHRPPAASRREAAGRAGTRPGWPLWESEIICDTGEQGEDYIGSEWTVVF